MIQTLSWFSERPLPPNVDSGSNPYARYDTSSIVAQKFSQGGTGYPQMLSQLAIYGPLFFRPETAINTASITAGTNDYIQGRTPTETYAGILQFVSEAKAMGYNHVIVETVISALRFDTAAGNTWRDALNALIRNGAVANGYLVSDPASDAILGCRACYLNSTYFNTVEADIVHPTTAGNLIKGQHMHGVLSSVGFQ